MSLRPKWQNFGKRNWDEVRDSWLAHIPIFPSIGARPDPGLERLEPLLELAPQKDNGRFPDVDGLRPQTLWEAVFLFHKCAHTSLAAQRLGQQGMHSWCLFNAYHSAYLGAKGIMALLGVSLPNLKGNQVAIDLYPEPSRRKSFRQLSSPRFEEFVMVGRLPRLDQRYLWEAFQRVLRMSDVEQWDASLCDELLDIRYEDFSRPRNHFLYNVRYWPLDDLTSDADLAGLIGLSKAELNVDDDGFLLNLSFSVYRLFEKLMSDLAAYSEPIKEQLGASRFVSDPDLSELSCYRDFISQISLPRGGL